MGITNYGFKIILIIMLGVYKKIPILQNPKAILVGKKAFF